MAARDKSEGCLRGFILGQSGMLTGRLFGSDDESRAEKAFRVGVGGVVGLIPDDYYYYEGLFFKRPH